MNKLSGSARLKAARGRILKDKKIEGDSLNLQFSSRRFRCKNESK